MRYAFGQRIYRRECLFGRHLGILVANAVVFRVHNLQAERSAANLTETVDPHAANEPILLRGREIEEPQSQKSGAVRNPAQQLAPLPVRYFGELNLSFHGGTYAGKQSANLPYARAVFIAQRQDKQEILHLGDTEALQLLRERRSDAAHRSDRSLLRWSGRTIGSGFSQGTRRTRSRRERPAEVAPRRRLRGPEKAGCSRWP